MAVVIADDSLDKGWIDMAGKRSSTTIRASKTVSSARAKTEEIAGLPEAPVSESEEVSPGVMLDFDAQNRVVGIEVLGVKKRLPGAQLKQIQFEVA